MTMNQSFSNDELVDNLGRAVRSAVELVAKTSPLDIRTVEAAVESGLGKIKDRLANDFELVKKTEYETNVQLLKMLKKQVSELEKRISELEKGSGA
jgi:BMFP domain-containing protein YqiC